MTIGPKPNGLARQKQQSYPEQRTLQQPGAAALRVLAADDSAVMRGILRSIFEQHAASALQGLPRMELCGLVGDGIAALAAVERLQPDVLLLDLEMPRMGGLEVLDRLRIDAPWLPVIICSSHSERGADATLDALSRGANDYVLKLTQQGNLATALETLKLQLLPKIAALWRFGRSSGATAAPSHTHVAGPQPAETRKPAVSNAVSGGGAAGDSARVELVVIGVSTGGPAALEKLLPMFPADFAVPMMIVQHMPKLFTPVLANRLNQLSGLTVSVAQEGSRVVAGACLFAPGDAHMEVAAPVFSGSSATAHLHTGKPLNSCTPAVDYLFFSAARIYGRGTLAIVLTGMGDDGVAGARAVREAGGTVFAQDQASSAVWGMPGRVSREGIAHQTLSLQSLAYTVQQRVRVGRGEPALQTNYARQAVDDMTDRRTEVIYGLL